MASDLSGLICLVGIFIFLVILVVLYIIFKDAFSSNTKSVSREYRQLQGTPPPQTPQTIGSQAQVIKEKEIIKEIVKVKCPYCGALIDQGADKCPHCGAPLK